MKYKCVSLIVFFVMLLTAGFSQQNDNSARDSKKSPTKLERHYENTESQMGVQFHQAGKKKPRDPIYKAYHEARRQGDIQKMRELEKQFKRPAANVGDSKGPLTRRKSTTVGFPGEPIIEGGSGQSSDWGDDIHVRGTNTTFQESYPAMATASNGDIYVAWENINSTSPHDYIQVYKSTDGGLTWTAFGFIQNSSFDLGQPSLAIGEGSSQNLLVVAYVVNDAVPFIEVATSPLTSFSFTSITPPYYAFWLGYSKPNVWTDSYDYSSWYIYLTAEAHVNGTTNYNVVFWRSTDYGVTYTDPAGVPLGNSDPYTWQDPDGTYGATGNDIYIAAFNATDNYLYVIRSLNFGSTWSDTFQVVEVNPLPSHAVDPDIEAATNLDNIMLTCTKSFNGADNIGQTYSTNAGLSWSSLFSLEGYTSTNEFAVELTANEGGNNWHLCYTTQDWWVYYSTRPQDLSDFWQANPDQVNDIDFASASFTKKAITSNWNTDVPGIAWADYRDGTPDYDIYFDRNLTLKLYQGPAIGNIAGGAMENTGNFSKNEGGIVLPEKALEKMTRLRETPLAPTPLDMVEPLAPLGSNEYEDAGMPMDQPLLVDDFTGIADTPNSAGFRFNPPDPICAAGPNHIMAAVNTDFAIFDKSGVKLKEIDATEWFESVLPGLDPGLTEPFGIAYDPQIVYDHFANHWVMIYVADNNSSQSYLLLSVSDDSDPIGVWYNYAIPGNANGMTFNTFQNDFPKLGIDGYNFYITANMFDLAGGGFQYVQLRAIEKYQIYNNPAGPLGYVDFWDLRDPDNLAQKLNTDATVAPAVMYGSPGVEYLVNASPYSSGTFMTLWQVLHPYAPDSLTAVNVPVTAYEYPPDAGQPGTPPLEPIDTGGWRVRNAVYRDGFLWTAHSVADVSSTYSRARYVKIDVTGPSVPEDISYGLTDYWYYYPAITADVQGNSIMVFNRSGTSEFAGIRFAGTEGGIVSGSYPLKAGEVDHENLDGIGRNRWGDYSGIAVDPANPSIVWAFSEYATINQTTWGTWWGELSFNPHPQPGNLVALDGYDGSVPLYWDPPVGIAPLKPVAGSAANSARSKAPSLLSTEKAAEKENLNISKTRGIEANLLSYNISRGTNPGGPYSPIANVNRQYYRDITANNGMTYYYIVQAVYDDGISIPSIEADGSPIVNGYVIYSGFTNSPPTLDGSIQAAEWADASSTDITAIGSPSTVRLYTMNDGNYLYLAVDDPNDINPEDYDELGLYFDEDHNFEWPMSAPSGEGNLWPTYFSSGSQTDYRGISGWWPNNLTFDLTTTATGANQAIDFSTGHAQYEVQIDLSASELNAMPGDDIGWYMFSLDIGTNSFYGNWPTDISPLGGGTWPAPFGYGTLVLGTPSITPTAGMLYASTGNSGATLITIDPLTGAGTPIAAQGAFGPVTEIEFREDSVLFGATGQGTSNIITINPVTGLETLIGTHTFGSTNGLEFDGSGNLLGTFYDAAGSGFTDLVIVNQTTGNFSSIIGPTGIQKITGLALHSNGTLYGSGGGPSSNLYTINPSTGAATPVGPIGFDNVGALEFGPDGVLYGGVGQAGGAFAGHLITIDPATGAGTDVGPSGFPGISGLSFYPGGCTPGLLGDVNDDGFVNSTDALILLSYDAGVPIPQPFLDRINLGFGDGNGDGFTNSTDALLIISFDVGIPVPFPVGDPVCL